MSLELVRRVGIADQAGQTRCTKRRATVLLRLVLRSLLLRIITSFGKMTTVGDILYKSKSRTCGDIPNGFLFLWAVWKRTVRPRIIAHAAAEGGWVVGAGLKR